MTDSEPDAISESSEQILSADTGASEPIYLTSDELCFTQYNKYMVSYSGSYDNGEEDFKSLIAPYRAIQSYSSRERENSDDNNVDKLVWFVPVEAVLER